MNHFTLNSCLDMQKEISNKSAAKHKKTFQCNLATCGKIFLKKSDFLRHKTSHVLQKSRENGTLPRATWIEDTIQNHSVSSGSNEIQQCEKLIEQLKKYTNFIQQKQINDKNTVLASGISSKNFSMSLGTKIENNSDFEDEETIILQKMIKFVIFENQFLKKKLKIVLSDSV